MHATKNTWVKFLPQNLKNTLIVHLPHVVSMGEYGYTAEMADWCTRNFGQRCYSPDLGGNWASIWDKKGGNIPTYSWLFRDAGDAIKFTLRWA